VIALVLMAWNFGRTGDVWALRDWFLAALVCVSFSFPAVGYYARIFAAIDAWKISPPSDLLMRITGIGFAPMLWVLLAEPAAWPIFSAYGAGYCYLNNRSSRALCQAADRALAAAEQPMDSESMKNFRMRHFEWADSMRVYSILLAIGALLLWRGWASDAWVYAIVAIVTNWTMYFQAIRRDGDMVRRGISRLLTAQLRLSRAPAPSAS
jgi:hypothetical protein